MHSWLGCRYLTASTISLKSVRKSYFPHVRKKTKMLATQNIYRASAMVSQKMAKAGGHGRPCKIFLSCRLITVQSLVFLCVISCGRMCVCVLRLRNNGNQAWGFPKYWKRWEPPTLGMAVWLTLKTRPSRMWHVVEFGRTTNFRGNRPTNTQHTQTHAHPPTDRTDYNTLHRLA